MASTFQDEPPTDLIHSLVKLQESSQTVAPYLAGEIEELVPIFAQGLETNDNLKRLAEFGREIHKLETWMRDISEFDPYQELAANHVQGDLNDLAMFLETDDENLTFFNEPATDQDHDAGSTDEYVDFIKNFKEHVTGFKKKHPSRTPPGLASPYEQTFKFTGTSIHKIDSDGTGLSIGSFNVGKQEHTMADSQLLLGRNAYNVSSRNVV